MKDSIAIIGSGRGELGKKMGSIIDSYEYVARFQGYSLAEKEDYVSKVNIYVTCLNPNYPHVERWETEYDQVFCVKPYDLKVEQNMIQTIPKGVNVEFIPPDIYSELEEILQAPPSTGMSFLFWLYKVQGSLENHLILGFDFYSVPGHYWEKDLSSWEGHAHVHNWTNEKKLFSKMTGKSI